MTGIRAGLCLNEECRFYEKAKQGKRGEDKSTTTFKHVPNIVLQSDYAQCRTKVMPPELAHVVRAWPELPEPIRAAILAIVKSATGEHP